MTADRLAQALQALCNRIELESATPLDWSQYDTALAALAAYRAQASVVKESLTTQAPAEHTPADRNIEAAVDTELGIKLLPPIRVPAATATLIEKFAALEGVIVQSVVRDVLVERFSAQAPAEGDAASVIAEIREGYRGTEWGKAAESICDKLAEALANVQPKGTEEPEAWQVWWGLGKMRPHWPPFKTRGDAETHASMIKSKTEVRPLYVGAAQAPAPEHVPASPEHAATIDDKLGLVLLPPIRVDRATHAALMESCKATGKIIQAVVRDRLAPYAVPSPAVQHGKEQP